LAIFFIKRIKISKKKKKNYKLINF
jgi:hypothetical protein